MAPVAAAIYVFPLAIVIYTTAPILSIKPTN